MFIQFYFNMSFSMNNDIRNVLLELSIIQLNNNIKSYFVLIFQPIDWSSQ